MRSGWRLVLAVMAAGVVVAGCSTTVAGTAEPLGAGGTPGQQQRTQGPPDRDLQAVTVALRKIDACKLFDLPYAHKHHVPHASLMPNGPHGCILTATSKYSPGDDSMRLAVGDNSDFYDRYHELPVTLSGVKAYQSKEKDECHYDIPVSFIRSVTLDYDTYGGGDPCSTLKPYAASAASKLRNPASIALSSGAKRPFAAWDGCFFLGQLLGDDDKKYTFDPNGTYDPFSGCQTTPQDHGNNQLGPKLETTYDQWPPSASGSPTTIAGHTVYQSNEGGSCTDILGGGDSGTGNKWSKELMLKFSNLPCDSANALITKAVSLIGGTPSDADAKAQNPLVYLPNEPDTGALGACNDFGATGGQADCQPYQHADVPQGTDQILAAADADRMVTCAVFKDAVTAVYGPKLAALGWGDHCFFVEPTHTFVLTADLSAKYAPGEYGKTQDLYTDRKTTQFAGKQAISFWDSHHTEYDIYLSPYNDLNKLGMVHLEAEPETPRGDLATVTPKVDMAKMTKIEQVVTQITQQYFH